MSLPMIGDTFEYDGVEYVVCEKREQENKSLDCFQKYTCGNLRCDLQSASDCMLADPEQSIFACHAQFRNKPVCARFKRETVMEWEDKHGKLPDFAAVFHYDWHDEGWRSILWGDIKKFYEEERNRAPCDFQVFFEPIIANPRHTRPPQWGEPGLPILARAQGL